MEREAKNDSNKPQIHLVPMAIVPAIARIREYGTEKYIDPENWKRVEPIRYYDAMMRHAMEIADDLNKLDSESGLPHLWHIACNVAFMIEQMNQAVSIRGVTAKEAYEAGKNLAKGLMKGIGKCEDDKPLPKSIEDVIKHIRSRDLLDVRDCEDNKAVGIALEALEKQIPGKPYMESDGYADGYPVWDYYCESCHEDFDQYRPKYCWECGQAIDWDEVK